MSTGSRLLLVGLRGSGKTSYLAALWHLVESGECPTALVCPKLQPDREYLNGIRDRWLRLVQVGRTSLRTPATVSLHLADAATSSNIALTVPDLSGELFRLQWATRKATIHYASFASECSGLVLFVHPDGVKRTPRIPIPADSTSIHDEQVGAHGVTPVGLVEMGEATIEQTNPWTPDQTSTQIQLVELLQFVYFLQTATTRPRVAIIISAWDLVREAVLPISWVERRLPLLHQFLVANADSVLFRVYGVSAVGGDLEKDIVRLRDEPFPSKRIKVVDQTLESNHDLTAPIRFALGLADKQLATGSQS